MVINKDVYKSFHTPGCHNYVKRPKNAVFISTSNTLKHEVAKLVCSYFIRKYSDCPPFNEDILDALDVLENLNKEWDKKFCRFGCDFITEAVMNKDKTRKPDIVRLSDGMMFEIETTKRRAARFDGLEDVTVIKLWRDKK